MRMLYNLPYFGNDLRIVGSVEITQMNVNPIDLSRSILP